MPETVLSSHLVLRFVTKPAVTPEPIARPQKVPPLVSALSGREVEVEITVQQLLPLLDVPDGPQVFLLQLGVPVELSVGTAAVVDP